MTYDEAETIRAMIEGHWNMRMNDDVADLWLSHLVGKDPEISTRVVSKLARTMNYPPHIKDLEEVYAMMDPAHGLPPSGSCSTCGGDLFVVVSLRPSPHTKWAEERGIPAPTAFVEEYAPCPDCNMNVNTEYRLHDGTLRRCPDPARVREVMLRSPRDAATAMKGDVDMPGWIKRWKRARNTSHTTREEAVRAGVPNPVKGFQGRFRDLRPLPEQAGALSVAERPSAPFDDREHWVQESEYLE